MTIGDMKCSSEQLDNFGIWPSIFKWANSAVTLVCKFESCHWKTNSWNQMWKLCRDCVFNFTCRIINIFRFLLVFELRGQYCWRGLFRWWSYVRRPQLLDERHCMSIYRFLLVVEQLWGQDCWRGLYRWRSYVRRPQLLDERHFMSIYRFLLVVEQLRGQDCWRGLYRWGSYVRRPQLLDESHCMSIYRFLLVVEQLRGQDCWRGLYRWWSYVRRPHLLDERHCMSSHCISPLFEAVNALYWLIWKSFRFLVLFCSDPFHRWCSS